MEQPKSSETLANDIVVKEKALQAAIEDYQTVLTEQHNLSREILEKRIAKKDYDIKVDKAKSNMRKIQLDIKILERAFWAARNSGT